VALVCPARDAALGLPPLDAAACGCPLVLGPATAQGVFGGDALYAATPGEMPTGGGLWWNEAAATTLLAHSARPAGPAGPPALATRWLGGRQWSTRCRPRRLEVV
jgi:hypothetical protein